MPRIKVAELFVPIVADASEFTDELMRADDAATGWASNMARFGKKALFTGVIASAAAATTAVTGVGAVLGKLAVEAAPLEGIGRTFSTMAQRFNVSLADMREAAGGTIDDFELMQQANLALTGLTQDLGEQFGQKLPDLLLTARAAARSTGESVEYMYTSLINGIKRASPRLIDNTGLVVELGRANKKMADELGITVEQMSEEEKALATLNAVTERGLVLAEQIGLEHETAQEKIQRFTTTIRNAKDQIGLAFNPAVKAAADALNDLATTALEPLAPLLERTVSPAITLVIERLHTMASTALESGYATISGLAQTWSAAAEAALRWGVNIVAQLASGMAQGAATVLVSVMNYISSVLSGWLAPGSPPKIAPDLPEWGMAAMNEYLKGFTMGSFDILEGIQAPLRRVLDAMVDAGDMGEAIADQVFEGMSVRLVEAIDKFRQTGQISQRILQDLQRYGGRFGDTLSELIQRQFALAKATDEVRRAEEMLAASRKKEEAAQSRLVEEIETYNQMLRAGASREALKAQRARVDEARAEMEMAEDQIRAAERQEKAAKKRIDPLTDQVKLQERLLDQLLKFTDVQEEAEKGGGGGGRAKKPKGGAGDIMPDLPEFGGVELPEPDFTATSEAFDEAKDNIAKRFADIFAPLTDAWNEEIKPALDSIRTAWDGMVTQIKRAWEQWGKPVMEELKEFIPPDLVENIGKVIGAALGMAVVFGVLYGVVALAAGALSLLFSPITLLIVGLGLLVTAWENNWGDIQGITKRVGGKIVDFLQNTWWPLLGKIAKFVAGIFTGAWKGLVRDWDAVKTAGQAVASFFTDTLWPALQDVGRFIRDVFVGAWNGIVSAWEWVKQAGQNVAAFFVGFWENLQEIIGWVTETFGPGWKAAALILKIALKGAVTIALNVFNNWWESLQKIWAWVKANLLPIFAAVANYIKQDLKDSVDLIKTVFGNWWGSLKKIWAWIKSNLLPIFASVANYVKEDLKDSIDVIKTVFGNWWESLKTIISWIKETLLPAFGDVAEYTKEDLKDSLDVAKKAANFLWEKFQEFRDYLIETAIPALEDLDETVSESLTDALNTFKDNVLSPLETAFEGIGTAISGVIDWFGNLKRDIANYILPDWLQRKSPSPFEMVFIGANEQMEEMARRTLPRLRREMNRMAQTDNLANVAYNRAGSALTAAEARAMQQRNEFNLYMQTQAERGVVERGFEVMRQRVPSST